MYILPLLDRYSLLVLAFSHDSSFIFFSTHSVPTTGVVHVFVRFTLTNRKTTQIGQAKTLKNIEDYFGLGTM